MRWHTADFDTLDWHGVHVHGWRIVERGPGEADLMLDIDWILERPPPAGARQAHGAASTPAGGDRHLLAQAMLVFHEVAGLRMAIDYAACSAASGPFAIQALHRAPLVSSGQAEAGAVERGGVEPAAVASPVGEPGHRDGEPADSWLAEPWPADPWPADEAALIEARDDYGPWRWRIDLAWPEGEFTFEASGFSQWLVGEPQALEAPVLPASLRS